MLIEYTPLIVQVVKSLTEADKKPKEIENWIDNIRELHRVKPPPNVHYLK